MCNVFESVVGSEVDYGPLTEELLWLAEPRRVFPGYQVPIVYGDDRELQVARWGFEAAWQTGPLGFRPPTNAKCETVENNRLFSASYAHTRCLLPCAYYVEWREEQGRKVPWRIGREDGAPFFLAGFYSQIGEGDGARHTACVITTAANTRVAEVHHRMPLILPREVEPAWLNAATPMADLRPLLRPCPNDWLTFTPDDPSPRPPKAPKPVPQQEFDFS